MFDEIQKVSRSVMQVAPNLVLNIHIKLFNEKRGRKENFHNVFSFEGSKTLKIDLQSFLTLELKDGGPYARNKTIVIDDRNIYQIKKGFERSIKAIYDGGVFAVNKKGETIIFADKAAEHTIQMFNLGMNQRMILKPAIIYDQNEVSYEGAILYLNNFANFIEMPIDTMEAFYNKLTQVDMFVYSQLLLNYYVSALKEDKIQLNEVVLETKSKPKKRSPFDDSPAEEEVKSTEKPNKDVEEFFGTKEN